MLSRRHLSRAASVARQACLSQSTAVNRSYRAKQNKCGTRSNITLVENRPELLTLSSPGFFGSSQPGRNKVPPIITFLLLGV